MTTTMADGIKDVEKGKECEELLKGVWTRWMLEFGWVEKELREISWPIMAIITLVVVAIMLTATTGVIIGFAVAALRASESIIRSRVEDLKLNGATSFVDFQIESDEAVSLIAKAICSIIFFMATLVGTLSIFKEAATAGCDERSRQVLFVGGCACIFGALLIFLVPPVILQSLAGHQITWSDLAKVWAVIMLMSCPFNGDNGNCIEKKDEDKCVKTRMEKVCEGFCHLILGIAWFAFIGFVTNQLSLFLGIFHDPFDVSDKVATIFGVFRLPFLVPLFPFIFPAVFPL